MSSQPTPTQCNRTPSSWSSDWKPQWVTPQIAANLHKLLFAFMRCDWILSKNCNKSLCLFCLSCHLWTKSAISSLHMVWSSWQTGCQHCCHHCIELAGRWHRLAAGSKNVPPDLEFELRDRKLPDLHLKTGTRGREYNDLHLGALIQMQKRSLTKLSNGNNGPLFCRVLSFKPEDTSL